MVLLIKQKRFLLWWVSVAREKVSAEDATYTLQETLHMMQSRNAALRHDEIYNIRYILQVV